MSEHRVPVKLWLAPEVYRTLAAVAAQRSMEGVGEWLETQAHRTVEQIQGRHPNTAITRARLKDDDYIAQFCSMFDAGATNVQIGLKLGISLTSVQKLIRQHRPNKPQGKLRGDAFVARFLQLFDAGMRQSDIARELGVSSQAIVNYERTLRPQGRVTA